MANKKKSKSTVKKQPTKKQAENLADAQLQAKFGETSESADKIVEERKKDKSKKSSRLDWEERYPGITEQIQRYSEAELPSCPHCKSDDTAIVRAGVIGRSITIAGSTRKLKLVLNKTDEMGTYFCNECKKYFD